MPQKETSMKLKSFARALALSSFCALGASSLPVMAQRPPVRPVLILQCPNPSTETMTVTAMNPNSPDFAPLPANTRLGSGLNDRTTDQFFRHTFNLKSPGTCCEIMSATLTIQVASNSSVTVNASGRAPDSGNDTWSVVGNGTTIAGNGEGYVYSTSGGLGTTRTITANLNAAALAHMNSTGRLSFLVQDDTRVTSATLRISRCCLHNKR